MNKQSVSIGERRSFLARLNTGAASIAALAAGGVAMAQEKPAAAARWEPARHDKDDWMDAPASKHRMVIDTTSPDGFRNGLLFASNFMSSNRDDYGLQNQDLAVIVVVRHIATGYGFNDDMWAKYGANLAGTQSNPEPAKTNSNSRSLASLSAQGVRFAVCSMATRRLAGAIARATGVSADNAFAELSANLVANSRLVTAGVVAVSRAQERRYSLVSS